MSIAKMLARSTGGPRDESLRKINKGMTTEAKLRVMLGMDEGERVIPTPPNDYHSYGTLKHERQKVGIEGPPASYQEDSGEKRREKRQNRASGGSIFGVNRGRYAVGGSPIQDQGNVGMANQPKTAASAPAPTGGYGAQYAPGTGQQPAERRNVYSSGGHIDPSLSEVMRETSRRRDEARGYLEGNHSGGNKNYGKSHKRHHHADGGSIQIEIRRGNPKADKPHEDMQEYDKDFMDVLDRHGIQTRNLSERDLEVLGRGRDRKASGGLMMEPETKANQCIRRTPAPVKEYTEQPMRRGGRAHHAAGAVAKVRKGQY